ncbi:hypothetical protein NDN08_004125 [Rhodosorus marinus]|uniref:Aminotransferase class I/classII large domain-containing protein n=1 Tax=Rhodosorus marinus TaxID=101924 RepID=A0AAV8UKC8_9RHOD|nr:hypothetical protein NDN08_004125 [Rhodosorus marinus]
MGMSFVFPGGFLQETGNSPRKRRPRCGSSGGFIQQLGVSGRVGRTDPICGLSSNEVGDWLDDRDTLDDRVGFSKDDYLTQPKKNPGDRLPIPRKPWEGKKLFIPDELLADPVFKWEVQGLMVQHFRGRLDESYSKEIDAYRKDRPEVTEDDLKARAEYQKAAKKAIQENPQDWLLRNWRTNEPVDLDSVYKNPLLMLNTSKDSLRTLSTQPPMIEPEVLEELDELAIDTVLKLKQDEQEKGLNLVECTKCGRLAESRELVQNGKCAFCNRDVAEQKRQAMVEAMESEEGSEPQESKLPRRNWPTVPSRNYHMTGSFLMRYLRNKMPLDISQANWLLWIDPSNYSEIPGESSFLSAEERYLDGHLKPASKLLFEASRELDDEEELEDFEEGEDIEYLDRMYDGCDGCANVMESIECLQTRVHELNSTMYRKDDVCLASGAAGAFRAALEVLCSRGENILVPEPTDGMFESVAESLGVEVQYYQVVRHNREWGFDLQEIAQMMNSHTAALIVKNPNSIGGFLHSREDLAGVCDLCGNCGVPIIADEVLSDFVFDSSWISRLEEMGIPNPSKSPKFVPTMEAADGKVPVLTIGETSHRFQAQLLRLGWLLVSADPSQMSEEVRFALRTVGTAQLPHDLHVVAGSLSQFLDPRSIADARATVDNISQSLTSLISNIHRDTFECSIPSAGMSVLVKVDLERFDFSSTRDFTEYLLKEQNIGIVPGSVFHVDKYCFLQPTTSARMGQACYEFRLFLDRLSKTLDKKRA